MILANNISVPLEILVVILAVSFPAVIGLMAWIVKSLISITGTLESLKTTVHFHEEKFENVDEWQKRHVASSVHFYQQ